MLRIGEIVEGLDRLLVQELEHAVVSGDASFAVAQDVDRREIQYFPVEPPEFAKESGEVVDGNGARVADAKGVEDVCHGPLALENVELVDVADNALHHLERLQQPAVG